MLCLAVLLLCFSMLAEAQHTDIVALHVTPVQYVARGDSVQLECTLNVTKDISKLLPDDLRMTWYDGFIPIPSMSSVLAMDGYQLRQVTINVSVSSWLQYGRYVCKIEDNNGTVTVSTTAVVPEGMQQENLFDDVSPEHPSVVTVDCPTFSSDVLWSKLAMDRSEQPLQHRDSRFRHFLSSYDQSVKLACYNELQLYSIFYVHPKNYDPVRFIFPDDVNSTLVFDNLDAKLIECKTTGSLQPNISWAFGSGNNSKKLVSDVVKRLHVVDVSTSTPPYVLQLNLYAPVPYVDSGRYVCIVENEWEMVNRSIIVRFEILLQGYVFHVSTFPARQYMFEGEEFTTRCSIQVDEKRRNLGIISVSFLLKDQCNDSSFRSLITADVPPRIKFSKVDLFDQNGDRWIIATLMVSNTTPSDSGCYQCLAATFEHTELNSSEVFSIKVPFNITSYELEARNVVKGSNITLSCEITVGEDYDMELLSVSYRFYVDPAVDEYVTFSPIIYTSNNTIIAEYFLAAVDIQQSGIYECYVRSLPADFNVEANDFVYEDAVNNTLFVTKPTKPADSIFHNRVTVIIIVVLSVMSIVTLVCIVLMVVYIIRKRRTMSHHQKSRLPSFMDEDSLLPVSPDIPSEMKSLRQPCLLVKEIVSSGWYFPHSDLKFEGTLGSGEFGIVMSALATNIEADKPVSKVAVKILPGLGDEEVEEELRKELAALSLVGCYKHIVGMMGASYIEGKLEIIVEFCAKGSLLHYLRAKRNAKDNDFQPKDAIDFAHQIALGMDYLAEKKCVHCDLAARNILITEDNILKVSDFGLARKMYDEIYKKSRTSRTRLPVRWMAIESIRDLSFTTESDVWAFGIVLWEIVQFGSNPYPGIENRKILSLLKRGYRMPQPPGCPDEFYKVMRNCWKAQPSDRPSFSKLVVHLKNLKEKFSSSPHGYVNWCKELSSNVETQEVPSSSDISDSDEGDEEKEETPQVKEMVCPVHGRLSMAGDDSKLLVKEQHSVDSGISSSTENIHKKSEASKVSYVNATNKLFKIHDRLRLQSADSGLSDSGTTNFYSPSSIPPVPFCLSEKKQAIRVDSGMPDSPCDTKTSPPYTNVVDTFTHFPTNSPPIDGNTYCTDPTSAGTRLCRRLSAHPDNRQMYPELGIKESDV